MFPLEPKLKLETDVALFNPKFVHLGVLQLLIKIQIRIPISKIRDSEPDPVPYPYYFIKNSMTFQQKLNIWTFYLLC